MGAGNLTIMGFFTPDASNQDSKREFVIDFNPNTFTVNNTIQYAQPAVKGQAGGDPEFQGIAPMTFSIQFTIDGTGVTQGDLSLSEQKEYVKNKLKELREVTGSSINGKIHRPNYLQLLWGTFCIECILNSFNTIYTLFDMEGAPLRAKVTCNFTERIGPGENGRKTRFESPDLTKYKSIREGDILPVIAREHYDDPAYYMQIAKINKLKNFRNLPPGMKLKLPPMTDSNE